MTLGVTIVVAVLLVLGVGLLVFRLMRRSQTVVPRITDEDAAARDNVVGVDAQGREITEAQEPAPSAPRGDAAFESLLQDEIHDLGRGLPAAKEED
jgi:hypothetical protein